MWILLYLHGVGWVSMTPENGEDYLRNTLAKKCPDRLNTSRKQLVSGLTPKDMRKKQLREMLGASFLTIS